MTADVGIKQKNVVIISSAALAVAILTGILFFKRLFFMPYYYIMAIFLLISLAALITIRMRLPYVRGETAVYKEIENKSKEAAAEWQQTVDSITDIVFIQDKDFTIIKANKALSDALNRDLKDILGKKCYEVLHKLGRPWPNCPFEQARGDSTAHTQEVDDPNIGVPLLVTVSPILDHNGNLLGAVHIAKDITAIKRLDELKNEFVSTVSHELRTPLSITKEGISLVLDRIPGEINESQQKILTTARENIDRLARIINELLDISKIEAGKVELTKERFSLKAAVEKVLAYFEIRAKEKGLELRLNVPESIKVYADADKVIQVLTNLLSNSVSFTEKGYVEIIAQEKEDEVECAIADTGIGISEENLPKLFGKFQQFGRVAGPGERGTGLGLSIVKGLVEMHKGRIRAESQPGIGTRFIFTLPKYSSGEMFREYVADTIRKSVKYDTTFSIIGVSIDGLVELKEEMGKEKARSVITNIETILGEGLHRQGDIIVKDTGEIMLILSDCDKESTLHIIEDRLRGAVETYLGKNNITKALKIHFGYAAYPVDGIDENILIDKAKKSVNRFTYP